jgi:uncharacterized membrane protein
VLGVAFGGFFDGILLHQVLQWHHLLSLVDAEAVRDIRVQILADGLFHVLMYAIAAFGLWLLWRGRRGFEDPGTDMKVLAATVLGFSVWQFVDVVLFHWILQIHRIRVGVPNPLLYDLGWLMVFGVPTLALGLWLSRRAGSERAAEACLAVTLRSRRCSRLSSFYPARYPRCRRRASPLHWSLPRRNWLGRRDRGRGGERGTCPVERPVRRTPRGRFRPGGQRLGAVSARRPPCQHHLACRRLPRLVPRLTPALHLHGPDRLLSLTPPGPKSATRRTTR